MKINKGINFMKAVKLCSVIAVSVCSIVFSTIASAASHVVGEVVKGDGFEVVLNKAEFIGNKLKANFTISNKGNKDLKLSILSYEAKNDDGSKLHQEIICGTSAGGTVLPDDKLKGDVCWDGAVSPVKLYFKSTLFGGSTIVWEVKK